MLAGNRYGVPVAEVAQIIRHEHVQPAPSALPSIAGVVNLRGEILPVLDPRVDSGGRPLAAEARPGGRPLTAEARPGARAKEAPVGVTARDRRRILVVRLAGRTCGIAVDEVHEIVDVEDSWITPGGGPVEAPLRVTAEVRVGPTVMYLPDLSALLDPSLARQEPAE
jgi:chemotaxis signal transduction protein